VFAVHRRIAGFLVAGTLLTGIAACSNSSPDAGGAYVEPTGPAVAEVTVDAGNLYFKPDQITVPAGIVQFTMVNVQSGIHTFLIKGVSGYMLEVSGKGSTDTGKVELEPGEYVFYCNIPGHEQAGMKGKLTVTAP
jgi:uncharacterized cupredoxin-like copper-binding protein